MFGGEGHGAAATTNMESRIKSPSAGQPLPEGVQGEMEGALGADLSGVRVHNSPTDAADAAHLGAKAFTHGNDIWLGAGESAHDRKLMAHELTHVVQQGGGEPVKRRPADDANASGAAQNATHGPSPQPQAGPGAEAELAPPHH